MKIEPGTFCPLLKKNCIGNKCAWFTHIRGLNPNTGQEIDEWNCAISWMPMMAIEIAQKENQTGAAVESFRNEVAKANSENQQLYLDSIKKMEDEVIKANVVPLNQPIQMLNPSVDIKKEE